jgi:tight adherence protein C
VSGALVGLLFATGVCAALPVLVAPNRRLTERVSPLLGGVVAPPWVWVIWQQRLQPWLARQITGAAYRARLLQAGIETDPWRYRISQIAISVGASFGVICWFGLMSLTGRSVGLTRMLLIAGLVGIGALVVNELRLSAVIARRRREKFVELADVADLLALSVTAGEPLTVALAGVAEVSAGALGHEISGALKADLGQRPTVDVVKQLRDQADVVAVQRFFAGLAAAAERGTPIADLLRAQASDVRAGLGRELMESAGRREIAMLAPVVFLILPCVVVVALYPGLVAIRGVM